MSRSLSISDVLRTVLVGGGEGVALLGEIDDLDLDGGRGQGGEHLGIPDGGLAQGGDSGLSTNELESNDGFVVVLKSLNPRPAASSRR